jgi:soluble lytic murein transglycosylase-like protein
VAASCGAQQVYSRDAQELRRSLESGDASFLRQVDPSRLGEAARLGPGGAYFLSLHYDRLGMQDSAEALLALEWNSGGGIARVEAGRALMARARAAADWKAARARSEAFLGAIPGDREALALEIESLARLGEFSKALKSNSTRKPADYGPRRAARIEACLAAAASLSKSPGGQAAVDAMVRDERDADAILLLADLTGAAAPDSKPSLLRARRSVAQRDYGAACLDFSLFPRIFSDPGGKALVSDAGKAWLFGGKAAEGAALLSALDGKLPKARRGEKAMARLWAGRCYLAAGKAEAGRASLRACIELAGPGEEADAAAWFLIDAAPDRAAAISAVEYSARSWRDAGYFADIADRLLRDCLHAQDYAGLERLDAALPASIGASLERRIRYVLDRARSLDLLPRRSSGPSGPSSGKDAEDLSYFAIMEAAFLGGPEPRIAGIEALSDSAGAGPGSGEGIDAFIQAVDAAPVTAASPSSATPRPDAKPGPEQEFVRGLIDYGLPAEAADAAADYAKYLGPDFLRGCAKRLIASGRPIQSSRFMALLARTPGYARDKADLELAYPRLWRDEIETAAGEFGLPADLLYGLVRTESFFDPGALSRVGAIGLTQLMPDTARDAAQKLKLDGPDLSDPRLNLRLGASYLSRLIRYFSGDVAEALMSYNGGMGRVRAAAKENPSLPPDLLLEALPMAETREYVRKVLAAQAVYGYLYGDRPMSGAAKGAFTSMGGE